MAYKIILKEILGNVIGRADITVENNPLNGEVVTIGNYTTHLSNILYIQEV